MFSIFEKKVSFIAYSDFIPWYYWRGLEQTLFRLFVFVFVFSSPRNCFSSSCVLLFRNMHGGEHVLVEVPVVCVCERVFLRPTPIIIPMLCSRLHHLLRLYVQKNPARGREGYATPTS